MRRTTLAALVAGSIILCAVAAAIPIQSSAAEHPGVSAAIATITLAALLGVGLYAWGREGSERFGQILFATGLCWFLGSLSNADGELLYSVGRIFVWLFELMLVYALLAYPSGRIEDRAGKVMMVVAVFIVAIGYLPTVPLVEQYPLPTPFVDCGGGCPGNFFFTGTEPALIEDAIKPVREALVLGTYLAVAIVLAMRLRRASRSLRRTEAPVLGAAVLRFASASAYIGLRRLDAGADAVDAAALVALLSISVTAVGFLVGLLQWRIYAGGALLKLNRGADGATGPAEMRALVADCLGDPTVELFQAGPRKESSSLRWHDSSGRECDEPLEDGPTIVAVSPEGEGSRIAVRCEEGFRPYPHFLEAVCSCVAAGMDRQRLDRELADSLEDVAASRKRLVNTADSARQKIERDLHDGAQQHLVALRIKLELARDALEGDPTPGSEVVARLGPEVDEIIEEVRALAHGIYPPLLASGGLVEALRGAGLRSPLPISVDADGFERLPTETESTIYFCCMEALQNATKHAEGAKLVSIRLWREDGVRFEVRDDGVGFEIDSERSGSGITGMKDRVEASGGWLRVESRQGHGTRVNGCLPAAETP